MSLIMKKLKMFILVLALACLSNADSGKGKGLSHISVDKPHGEKYHFDIEHDGSTIGKDHHLNSYVGSGDTTPDSDHKPVHDEGDHDDHEASKENEEEFFFDHKVLGYGDFIDPSPDDHSDEYNYKGLDFDEEQYKNIGHADDKASDPFGSGKYAYHYGNYGTTNGLHGDALKGLGNSYGYKYGSYDVREGKGKKKPKYYGFSGHGHDGGGHIGYGQGHGGFGLGGYGGKGYGYGDGFGHGGYGYGGHGYSGYGDGGHGLGDYGHGGHGHKGYGHGGYGHDGHGHGYFGSTGFDHDGYKHAYGHNGYGSGYGHGKHGYKLFGNKGSDHDSGSKGYSSHILGDGHVYGYIKFSHPTVNHNTKTDHKHVGVSHNNKGGHNYKYSDANSYGFNNRGRGYGGSLHGGDDHGYSHDHDAHSFSSHSPKGYKYKYSRVYKGKPTNSWSYNYGEYEESYSSPGRHVEHHGGDSSKHY